MLKISNNLGNQKYLVSILSQISPKIELSLGTWNISKKYFSNSVKIEEKITNISKSEVEEIIQPDDEFTHNFKNRQIKLSSTQKFILSIGSSVAALIDPKRHDMIACLGETTGETALKRIKQQMEECDEGRQILSDRPRINTQTVDIVALRSLKENTFGRTYVKFLDDNNVTPDSRTEVRFMDDSELAYIMTRYRESHDLIHTILGMPTHMLGEVAVKWVEALNTQLPMCYGGAVFGAARLRPKQRQKYTSIYLPWAIANGKRVKPLLCVYWEKRWNQDITDLRKELGVTIL